VDSLAASTLTPEASEAEHTATRLPPGAAGEDRNALAGPIGDRLFSAGEATSREYPATAHGAYFSGGRAPDFLVAIK
jgi:hypothetical protein